MNDIKAKLTEHVKANFPDAKEMDFKGENRIDFSVDKQCIPSLLTYLKDRAGYIHLSHITCVDWLEEGEFEMIFIIWSPTDKLKVFIRTRIDRNNAVMPNIDMIWRQANTYEREFREMFGIQFNGLVGAEEFMLEDWQGAPPMRRDFDTAAYAKDAFFERPGREDALDVREEIIKRSREEIPDFAKKYSR
jgi:NADH-quinone oxidoreductase subunit C